MATSEVGLGNPAVLNKVDKLRELSVGAIIPLPQLIVVGDQSSGKSSVLESLTGFSFPRAAGLCTRYATQITCSREPRKSVSVSIIPRPDANETLKTRLFQFQRQITELDNDQLAEIFEEANEAMGLRMSESDFSMFDEGIGAFSQDILKIEISGPDQTHLTVIDVPGIFRVATPGLTTESDVTMVRNMVKSYMENSRTIILAVMPCNVDIATQEILKLAETADPDGIRTMGVLTKPDLAMEQATQSAVIDLVQGKRNRLTLGYCVVKNRSADDSNSSISDRLAAEKAFFAGPPWTSVANRCGIESLQTRLSELLMSISKRELPHVKADIENRLNLRKSELEAMGPSRSDQSSQRLYLGRIASRFQEITQHALNGYYTGNPIFKSEPNLKLATRAMELNEALSHVVLKRGHKRHFGPELEDQEVTPTRKEGDVSFKIPLNKYPELSQIIHIDEYECPEPSDDPLLEHVIGTYEASRGPEVGTFGGPILAIVFEEQSEKWEPLVLSHTSKAINMVHDYVFQLFSKLCPDTQVRNQLWEVILLDQLRDAYRRAMDHAHYLLATERRGRPSTFSHKFSENLEKRREQRILARNKTDAAGDENEEGESEYERAESRVTSQPTTMKDNVQKTCEDIVDTLICYYNMSRERFVDAVCQQVVNDFLLDGEKSPLRILSPEFTMSLDPEQLEMIAGEDMGTKNQRQALAREIESLEAAIKVLRV
ncbi:interferon-induced GTP-binding protein Mx2 [Annulohypoxylon truncatum]|uniref:interferon-induced GTP-binding protein Mx2 n=1 Tax=Annulohypoxylon truncatum TaxID=327061 RepID=UPI0020082E5B|nr:interferon-induced GTP-binding protein Mx2 [Annulohypoxylon truncatum]KAI1207487.1 interferon-induced GTP-binding protein Mx2 [Annulohypoxylon truncatum]